MQRHARAVLRLTVPLVLLTSGVSRAAAASAPPGHAPDLTRATVDWSDSPNLRLALLHDQRAGRRGGRARISPGWAFPAGVAGLVLAPAVLAMCIASDALSGDAFVPSLPLGVTAWGLAAITMPILYQGGKSARQRGGATGSQAVRTVGWIAYTLCNALLMGVPSAALVGNWPVYGLISAVGAAGALSLVLVSIDNLLCHYEVVDRRTADSPAPGGTPAVTVHPWAAPLVGAAAAGRGRGAVAGLGVRW